MTAVMNYNLVLSLPGVLMTEIYEYDDTYRIFGSDKFKKDLHNGWLKKQTSYVKETVDEFIRNRMYGYTYIFKNEYCYIIDPLEPYTKGITLGEKMCGSVKVHMIDETDYMVYVAPPKNDVLYYKILPKKFINNPKEFFENLRFDGFFTRSNIKNVNYSDKRLYHIRTF
jgi:hypothetical protein